MNYERIEKSKHYTPRSDEKNFIIKRIHTVQHVVACTSYKSPYAPRKKWNWNEQINEKTSKNKFSAIFQRCVWIKAHSLFGRCATVNKLPFWICAIAYTPFANLYTTHVLVPFMVDIRTCTHIIGCGEYTKKKPEKNWRYFAFVDRKIGGANGVKSSKKMCDAIAFEP